VGCKLVLRLLVHVYGTLCQHIYASVIVSDNLNGCSRLICLVLETAALCNIFVRSAVYKSSYLLTMHICDDLVLGSTDDSHPSQRSIFVHQLNDSKYCVLLYACVESFRYSRPISK